MTAVASTDVPWSKITTVEKLLVWCTMVLNDLNTPEIAFEERPGTKEIAIQWAPVEVYEGPDKGWYSIARSTIKLANTYPRQGLAYLAAQELSTQTIPSEYRT